jgi:molecular chaperone DnaK
MQENINFGIDLGTTNSAIGFYKDGKVIVLKNPKGFRETLPSAVAFRKGRILIGDKAIEQLSNGFEHVFTSFKRNMGTDCLYNVEEQSYTPTDLSALVLKEVLGFVQDNNITSAVITIPAAFDTVQSNATKKAGFEAGLKEVVLLQEPVAACLAYANENSISLDTKQTWLVYDFGGGTFDSALVEIDYREMKVVDHLGNNFLGGVDIDEAVLKHFVLPEISIKSGVELKYEEVSNSSKYAALKQHLIHLIEEAKKDLSLSENTIVEVDFPALDILIDLDFQRSTFNAIASPIIDVSFDLLRELLQTNNLSFSNIHRIVLVGGTTYIPLIREKLVELSKTIVDNSIDPTTAIVKGAAYFAGTKEKKVNATENEEVTEINDLSVQLAYEPATNDEEELVAFKCNISFKGVYRIISNVSGFATAWIDFKDEAAVFVPLQLKQINFFTIEIADQKKKLVFTNQVSISQGLYSISGQTLPLDICLEVDTEDGASYLEPIFKKNSILPLRKSVSKTLTKSISAGEDDSIFINVLEGRQGTLPGSNLSIGFVSINGKDLNSDLVKGTNVELKFSISESRDLELDVYVPSIDLTLKEKFNPQNKVVVYEKIKSDIFQALEIAKIEMQLATSEEQYELSAKFNKIEKQLLVLANELAQFSGEALFKIDENKRALLKELDGVNRAKNIYAEIESYKSEKESLLELLPQAAFEYKEEARKIFAEEKEVLNSGDKQLIKETTQKIKNLNHTLFYQKPENFALVYFQLKTIPEANYKDYSIVEKLIADGDAAMHAKNYELLKQICYLIAAQLLPNQKEGKSEIFKSITGLK